MDLELWSQLSAAISDVRQGWIRDARDVYVTALIARVHLWSVLHDRPTCWACDPRNRTDQTRPGRLPDQSTMSRRMRREDFDLFMARLCNRMRGRVGHKDGQTLLKVMDGKPIELPNHSTDRDAAWCRGVSRKSLGYKLHMIVPASVKAGRNKRPACMPDAFVITPLDRCEKRMAARMLKRVKGEGYALADTHYDASWLFDVAYGHGRQLLCPRAKPDTGLGHHYQSPHRLRCIQMLESPAGVNTFGTELYKLRTDIEREFGHLVSFGGGLQGLPPWVRRIGRVRRWVTAKLLVNAARIRLKWKEDA